MSSTITRPPEAAETPRVYCGSCETLVPQTETTPVRTAGGGGEPLCPSCYRERDRDAALVRCDCCGWSAPLATCRVDAADEVACAECLRRYSRPDEAPADYAAPFADPVPADPQDARIEALEQRVRDLRSQLAALSQQSVADLTAALSRAAEAEQQADRMQTARAKADAAFVMVCDTLRATEGHLAYWRGIAENAAERFPELCEEGNA